MLGESENYFLFFLNEINLMVGKEFQSYCSMCFSLVTVRKDLKRVGIDAYFNLELGISTTRFKREGANFPII